MSFFEDSKYHSLYKPTYVNLRWIAILGQLITVYVVYFYFNFEFNFFLSNIAILIGVFSNLYLFFFYKGTYLSNKYSDLLLYACLVNAFGYLKGPQDMLQYYQAAYNEALETYAIEQIGNRRRDEYQDGEVRAQLNVKSPSSYETK